MSENPKENLDMDDGLSLESILAEYKGEAYIADERKLSKEDLDQRAEAILQETLGEMGISPSKPESQQVEAPSVEQIPQAQEELPQAIQRLIQSIEPAEETVLLPELPKAETYLSPPLEETRTLPLINLPEEKLRHKLEKGMAVEISLPKKEVAEEVKPLPTTAEEIGLDESAFIEPGEDEASIDWKVFAQQQETDVSEEDPEARMIDEDDGDEPAVKRLFSRFRRNREDDASDGTSKEYGLHEEEGVYDEEDFAEDELSLHQAAGKYGRGVNRYQIRGMLTIILSLLMLLFTARGDAGASLPWALGTVRGLTMTLLMMQLLAMVLSAEVITTGLIDIIKRRPGVETLITVAALASIGDALHVFQVGTAGRGFPYSAVVAFSLGTALLGIKSVRNAMKTSLRTAATKQDPYVVTSKLDADGSGFSLLKSHRDTEGFLRKTQQMDFSEHIYSMAAPLLVVASLVFALFAALGGTGDIWDAIHHFAGMTAVSASFTGLLAYGIPYSLLSRKLSKVGAALAGWGGAAEVSDAKGVIVTDADVFPNGTLTLSGVKIFDKNEEKVIAYTASIIISSGCGLSSVFQDVLQKQNLDFQAVTDLACYEGGGIGAKVNGEELIVGSASLMNLMGVRLPQNLNVKNAVFTAQDGELIGVFAINYTPLNSVKEALVSLLHSKIKPLFAIRDFNVSPIMLQTKFQISTDKIDFLTYEARYALSDLEADPQGKPFAVLCREGLGPLADVVVGGKRLKRAVIRNTILSVASAVIGLILLLSIFWAGSAETASAANVFYYHAAWLFVMYVLSRTVTMD